MAGEARFLLGCLCVDWQCVGEFVSGSCFCKQAQAGSFLRNALWDVAPKRQSGLGFRHYQRYDYSIQLTLTNCCCLNCWKSCCLNFQRTSWTSSERQVTDWKGPWTAYLTGLNGFRATSLPLSQEAGGNRVDHSVIGARSFCGKVGSHDSTVI